MEGLDGLEEEIVGRAWGGVEGHVELFPGEWVSYFMLLFRSEGRITMDASYSSL